MWRPLKNGRHTGHRMGMESSEMQERIHSKRNDVHFVWQKSSKIINYPGENLLNKQTEIAKCRHRRFTIIILSRLSLYLWRAGLSRAVFFKHILSNSRR